MNSLNWLLSPKPRTTSSSSFQLQSNHQSNIKTTTSSTSNNSNTSIDNLISGPRESESELVDEMVEQVERLNGIEAANNLERKASLNSEGEVRVGLTGISERRRTLNLSLDEERIIHTSDSIHQNDHLIPLKTIKPISSFDSTITSSSNSSSTSDLSNLAHEPTLRSPILSSIASAATRIALSSIPTSSSPSSNTSSSLRNSISSENLLNKPVLKSLHSGLLKSLKSKSNSSSSPTRSPKPSSSGSLATSTSSTTSNSKASSSSNLPSVTIAQLDQHHKLSHQLARLLPVRLGVSLYILIRKFLAIFSLRLPPAPSEQSTPVLIIEGPTSNHKSKSISKLLCKPNLKSKISSTLPMIGSEEEMNGSLIMTDASSSADESDSTLTSNLLSIPSTPSNNSLHPPTKTRNGKPNKPINKVSIQPTSEPKPTVLGTTRNKTLVLDLDETLIHSTSRLGGMGGTGTLGGGGSGSAVHAGLKVRVVEVVLDGRIVVYHVYKRPWVDFFLKTVSSWYTVVIFTASMREYADPVIDWLDQGRGIIDGRLFRESCTNIKGSYMKDLTIVERDLSKVCLVDNSPVSYGLHQANGIPIEGWLNDPTDEGLLDLLPMLDSLRFTKDVRRILGLRGFSNQQTKKSIPISK